MQRVHCDGCGFTEEAGLVKSQSKLQKITLTVPMNPRYSEGTDIVHEADLCPGCLSRLLRTYFRTEKVNVGNFVDLELPAFLGPQLLDIR